MVTGRIISHGQEGSTLKQVSVMGAAVHSRQVDGADARSEPRPSEVSRGVAHHSEAEVAADGVAVIGVPALLADRAPLSPYHDLNTPLLWVGAVDQAN